MFPWLWVKRPENVVDRDGQHSGVLANPLGKTVPSAPKYCMVWGIMWSRPVGPLVVGHEHDEVGLRAAAVAAGLRGSGGDGQAGGEEQGEERREARTGTEFEGHGSFQG